MKLQNINPATNQVFANVEVSSPEQISEAVMKAHQAQSPWQALGVKGRVEILQKLYNIFDSEKEKLGELVTKSMGMPASLRNMLDIEAGLHYFHGYLENAENYLKPEISFEGFLNQIEQSNILVDFDARTGHNHGTKFRMRQNCLPSLYRKATIVIS